MALQIKLRYRYTTAGSWVYPPTHTLGTATGKYEVNDVTPPSITEKTLRILTNPIKRIPGNEVVDIVGKRKLEKDGGWGLEVVPTFPLMHPGVAQDEALLLFLQLYDAAPIKEVGYNDGFKERLTTTGNVVGPEDNYYMIPVVQKQVMDQGKKDHGNLVGVTLFLEASRYFASDFEMAV